MNGRAVRDWLHRAVYGSVNPVARFLIRTGLTPNAVTLMGLILSICVTGVFIAGALPSNRDQLGYVGWAGALILFAGFFDLLDGQVARLGNMRSTFGAMLDSVIDRYSEIFIFLGICYYLVAHQRLLSALLAFLALCGSMMVSYTRARSEGLGAACSDGLMQRPERIILLGLSAIACGSASALTGSTYTIVINGLPFHVFEPIFIFTFPLALMALLTNITAINRLRHAKKAFAASEKLYETGC